LVVFVVVVVMVVCVVVVMMMVLIWWMTEPSHGWSGLQHSEGCCPSLVLFW